MELNMLGANISYPYRVPNRTLDDIPGIWTMIGAADVVQERMAAKNKGKGQTNMVLDCGTARKDEK